MEAKRDQNRITVGLAKSPLGQKLPIRVDPITGRLLIFATIEPVTPVTAPLRRDQNRIRVDAGVTGGGEILPLRTNTDGELLVDLLIE